MDPNLLEQKNLQSKRLSGRENFQQNLHERDERWHFVDAEGGKLFFLHDYYKTKEMFIYTNFVLTGSLFLCSKTNVSQGMSFVPQNGDGWEGERKWKS